MEDILTDIPPPSRFFEEDLNNFTTAAPSPSPFIVIDKSNLELPLHPSLLMVAMSPPSLHVICQIASKTLIGSLILPEMPFSANSSKSSLKDRSCNIYSLNAAEEFVVLVSVQCYVPAERSHAIAKLIVGEQIVPDRVLILELVQSRNFRGLLSQDEAFALKLETSLERALSSEDYASLLVPKDLDYFPSGSVIDGLAAALLARCEIRKLRGTMCVSWPEHGHSAASLVKSLLLRVLPGLELTRDIGSQPRVVKDHAFDLYT